MCIIKRLATRYSLVEVCKMLYWIAQQKGGYDNTTIILIDLSYSTASAIMQ